VHDETGELADPPEAVTSLAGLALQPTPSSKLEDKATPTTNRIRKTPPTRWRTRERRAHRDRVKSREFGSLKIVERGDLPKITLDSRRIFMLPGGPEDDLARLVPHVTAGDAGALRKLLASMVPHLLRVSRRVLGPEHPFVEDVAHDAAYTVVQQLAQYRGEGTVLNFARRIAVHTALNMRRRDRAQKRARLREPLDTDELETQAPNPEATLAQTAVLPAVREVLDELPEQLAETLVLHLLLGHTVAEIAEIAAVPIGTVKSRLRLAKDRFKTRAERHPVLSEMVRFEQ
jgi:RNA polymerase sigma-70 factor (ECF subfamily)